MESPIKMDDLGVPRGTPIFGNTQLATPELEIYSSKTANPLWNVAVARKKRSMAGWSISFWDDLSSGAMWALGSVLSI